tara:strand:+ start:450 stop:1172 length:723 start_codon:yes stop_codon:yes gene_type:complete
MADEKELVKRIKNSIKAKQSRAEIIGKLQKRGYKLEYIDALMKKATTGKKFLLISSIILIIIIAVSITTYSLFFKLEKAELINPLEGLNINLGENFIPSTQLDNNSNQTTDQPTNQIINEIHIDEIEITPEFLSYLLNEIGAWQLHKNIAFEDPIINFDVSGQKFYSTIKNKIITLEGVSPDADMEFKTTKEILITAMLANNPAEVFKQSIQSGDTQINLIAGQAELFSKGYLKLYNSLK